MLWQNNLRLQHLTVFFTLLTIFSLTTSTALLSIASFILLALLLVQMRKQDWRFTLCYPMNRWLLALSLLIVIGLWYSAAPLKFSLAHLNRYLYIMVPLLLVPFCQKQPQLARWCLLTMIFTAAVSAIGGMIHYVFFKHIAFQDPAFTFVYNFHIYASLFEACAAFIAVYLLQARAFQYRKILYVFIVIITFHLMILSQSRTGNIVFFGLAAFSIWYFASGKMRIIGLGALLIATALAIYCIPILHHNFVLVYQNYVDYQHGNVTTSAAIRIDEAKLALQAWLHHPIFGYGTSGYWWGVQYVHQTHPNEIYYTDFHNIIYYPENTFLMTLTEQGLVGFILLWGFLISAWRMSYRMGAEKFLIQGLVIAFILFSLSQTTLYIHSSQTFFMLFFGVLLAKYPYQSSLQTKS